MAVLMPYRIHARRPQPPRSPMDVCPGWGSNPHAPREAVDFKSTAYAIPPPGPAAQCSGRALPPQQNGLRTAVASGRLATRVDDDERGVGRQQQALLTHREITSGDGPLAPAQDDQIVAAARFSRCRAHRIR